MAYFTEIRTPLKPIGIRFFKDDENGLWIKFFHYHRRPLRKKKAS